MDRKEVNEGFLLVDKPAGMSSFGVVARVRRVLSEAAGRKIKVGHAGTLDPFATGLLILLIGRETKRAGELLKLDKRYEATLQLGQVSSTGDPEGKISNYQGGEVEILGAERARRVLEQLTGEIEQKVPRYSAVKIKGKRAYELARAGQQVEMPVRKVRVYQLELVEYRWPELKINCKVSSGTYVRALGEEIGRLLGVGAYVKELRRTEVGEYRVEAAKQLADFGVE